MRDSQYLIVVNVPDEDTLHRLVTDADRHGVPHSLWHEPDLTDPGSGRHQATAVALAPTVQTRRLCANLPLAGRTSRTAPSPAPAPQTWGIQYYSRASDYPAWCDHEDYNADTRLWIPLRFPTENAAQDWLTGLLDGDLARRQARYHAALAAYLPRKARYDKRRQALQDAGLWTEDGEPTSPLVGPASVWGAPRHEPVPDTENWRVVPDRDMDSPTVQDSDGAAM